MLYKNRHQNQRISSAHILNDQRIAYQKSHTNKRLIACGVTISLARGVNFSHPLPLSQPYPHQGFSLWEKKKNKNVVCQWWAFWMQSFWMLKKWKERLSGGGWKGGGSLIEEKNYNWRFLFGSVKLGAPSLIEPFICISGYFWSKWLRQGGRFWNQPGRTILTL